MVTAREAPEISLASSLSAQARNIAEERDLDLDISLSGKSQPLARDASAALQDTADAMLASIGPVETVHHLALEIAYLEDSLHVRIEHDAALGAEARASVEERVLGNFDRIGGLGGSLSLSAGRGFGMRMEVTLPYADGVRSARPADDPRNLVPVRPASFDNPQFPLVERLTFQEATVL